MKQMVETLVTRITIGAENAPAEKLYSTRMNVKLYSKF